MLKALSYDLGLFDWLAEIVENAGYAIDQSRLFAEALQR
jgi:hypothetical protein